MKNNGKTKKEGRGWAFSGGFSFYMKNKSRSGIFNGKKKLWIKFFFSFMTKNLNWEISTKNLAIFKRWDGVNDKKFQYYGSSLKNPILFGAWKKFEPSYWHKYPKQITL